MLDFRTATSEYDALASVSEKIDLVARTILDGLVAAADERGADFDELVAQLPAEQRALAILAWSGAEIDNGGLWQLYTNSTGYHAPELPEAARLAGSEELAELFTETNSYFGGSIPRDRDERERRLQEAIPDDADPDPLDALDERYYALDAREGESTVDLLHGLVERRRDVFLA